VLNFFGHTLAALVLSIVFIVAGLILGLLLIKQATGKNKKITITSETISKDINKKILKKINIPLALLVLFIIMDALLTQYFVPSGKVNEANTFIAPLVGQPGFMIIKTVGALICAVLLWDVHRRFPKLGRIATWIAVVGYGAIVLWNASLVLLA